VRLNSNWQDLWHFMTQFTNLDDIYNWSRRNYFKNYEIENPVLTIWTTLQKCRNTEHEQCWWNKSFDINELINKKTDSKVQQLIDTKCRSPYQHFYTIEILLTRETLSGFQAQYKRPIAWNILQTLSVLTCIH